MTPAPDDDLQQAVDLLTKAVEDAPHRRLPGATLGVLLRRSHKSLLQQLAQPLTRFLDERVPRLTVVGRTGDDLVWGLDRDDDAPWTDIDALLEIDGDPHLEVTGDPSAVCLERVQLLHYRSARDVTLELSPLTVLVGPNGAGKSNLLDGIFRGVKLTHQKPASVFKGPHALDRVKRRDDNGDLAIVLTGTDGWQVEFHSGAAEAIRFIAQAGGKPTSLPSLLLTPFAQAFGPAVRLSLNESQLSQPTYTESEEPYLRHDGYFLPSVLDHLAGSDRQRLLAIIEAVREIVPQVEDLRTPRRLISVTETEVLRINDDEVRRSVVRKQMGNALEVKIRGSGWTPADQLSEGTLLAIGLHTVLAREVRPKVLLIDDLDRALHPNAQRTLVEQLQRLAGPQMKIVATTHSPFVLDPLEPTAVRFVQLDEAGATTVRPLTSHPAWPKWAGTMTPAEFWQYAGDDWAKATP